MFLKKVLFRVDAFLEIGTGHFYRCLTIAEKLQENKIEVTFVGCLDSIHLKNKLKNKNIKFYPIIIGKEIRESNKNEYKPYTKKIQEKDAQQTFNLNNDFYCLIIVDHYKLDYIWEKNIRKKSKRLMVIDDLSNRYHNCDLLLDQTFKKKHNSYKHLVNEDCEILIGEKYFLLRDEFISAKKKYKKSLPSKVDVLVSLGGGDTKSHTFEVCKEIEKLSFINKCNVVLGPLDTSKKNLFLELFDKDKFNLMSTTDEMGLLLAKSNIVIGASGLSTWERLFIGIPSFQLIVSDNQEKVAELLDKKKYIKLIKDISFLR